MLEIRLQQIKEILESDAKLEFKKNESEIGAKITIIDDRFHNIRQLIQQIDQKNNKIYRKIIELISNYIRPIYNKKDFDAVSIHYDTLLKEANKKFVIRLLKYIRAILKTYPNISIEKEKINSLNELNQQQNVIN